MGEALFWGLAASSSLMVGALVAIYTPIPKRLLALIMAFGAGVLISAVAFDLTEDAYTTGGADAVSFGLIAGALVFFGADEAIDRHANRSRDRRNPADSDATAVALGAGLDGIPESIVIGLSLLDGQGGVSVAIIAAVFMSNLPEALGSSSGFLKAGYSRAWVVRLWTGVIIVSGIASGAGYGLFGGASGNLVAFTQSFAAGALLAMLTDSMVPQAFKEGGKVAGVVTVIGFACAFLLSAAQ